MTGTSHATTGTDVMGSVAVSSVDVAAAVVINPVVSLSSLKVTEIADPSVVRAVT